MMRFHFLLQAIDKETETIILSKTESSIGAADLGGQIPDDEARYHFFLYKHHHEGDYLESIGKRD